MIHTAEAVTKYHPDKVCDQISDAILDACLVQDPYSRVAIETQGGHGQINVVGELTTKADVNLKMVTKHTYFDLFEEDIEVNVNVVKQSSNIAQGVDSGGAGDQGIMVGYACRETHEKIPAEVWYARDLLRQFHTDAKSQVTMRAGFVTDVVLSVQGKMQEELEDYLDRYFGDQKVAKYCNYTGSFDIGGFEADSGVTGRKIVVDAYGPRVPVGGGCFSGKDATKVDRSGAYMARWAARDLLDRHGATEVFVKLAYVIGKAEPLMQEAIIDGMTMSVDYDCRPEAIIERFQLRRPIYLDLAANGHFGRPELPWEKI